MTLNGLLKACVSFKHQGGNIMEDKTKEKLKKSGFHIFRRLSQILFFTFLPGAFVSAFYSIKDIILSFQKGTVGNTDFFSALLVFAGTVGMTALLGRFFCGFMCSFGAMGDLLWFISKKIFHVKWRINEKIDGMLKYLKYVILVFIFFGIWIFGLFSVDSLNNPWTVFGMYASIGGWPSAKYLISIGGLLLLIIMIGSMFIERFFCRYLCPMGAVFALVSKLRLFHIEKNREGCGKCRICTNTCIMGIPLYRYDSVKSGECINCLECRSMCPRHNIKANPAPAVMTVTSAAMAAGMIYLGNVVINNSDNVTASGTQADSQQAGITTVQVLGKYQDGVYSGTGSGFKGNTDVKVTVENGQIADITIVSYEDDNEYFNKAKNTIIEEIINAQDTDVDTVSGATFSSRGIIEAVRDALENSAVNETDGIIDETDGIDETDETDETEETDETDGTDEVNGTESSQTDGSEQTQAQESEVTTAGTYTDGVYTGTGTGLRGDTKVSVTVENGKITDITIVSYEDDEQFFTKAQDTVISEIIESQGIDVDTVSGATFSSNGIIEAVSDALGIAFTNPNSQAAGGEHGGHGGRR